MINIRVLIIDDSAFMRKMIKDILEHDTRFTVVGTARNGEDGLQKIKQLQPDVVTLDIEMPKMDGLTCLQHIMKENPLPVVMLSSLTHDGAESTIKAMEYGAVDFIEKPSGSISLDIEVKKDEIIQKVYESFKANLQEVQTDALEYEDIPTIPYEPPSRLLMEKNLKKIVAIGTSTGGPRALQQVITKLPADIPAPILIVQHMPSGFTKSLAKRLNVLSEIEVKEAENGEILRKGVAYIAPGNYHLKVQRVGLSLAIKLDQSDTRNGHRPSVDTMLESLAVLINYQAYAVIMTGMGSDGSEGLRYLKSRAQQTIAITESSESAIVYGMPKAAVLTNKVEHIVHLKDISYTLVSVMGKNKG
ncbi:chemotaxis-specific protein-glutamate methyltransferase CheB [Pontibacillus yanchengensis]|uniref:Chemotaxis-specific protein-glutamate methyltransferase CheB n=2 Tax=Pontibacillus yanchengensis TaxID=462910 RepID=A0ACC7V9Y0_9BACI|nr:chemotaxis response regulator protein-glutamate methylesterase [Pontibacillus yanchengensis]MYL33162.1 chemotaxis-specific protein-glutamate methyltransferase CheB [Pontibacillus yanchengensis]MYL51988.1 chemotaxis-specific protein-glutamate methyltransferase CheB [Pontibacillus yanchengensis]